MKFVIAWTNRDKSAEAQKAVLQAFEAWTPPPGITEFVANADGSGGGLVIEADDIKVLAEAIAPFTQWLDYKIVPVLDIADAVNIIKANLS
jgi:hypothetical protein